LYLLLFFAYRRHQHACHLPNPITFSRVLQVGPSKTPNYNQRRINKIN
jgi:hypothetical protein